MKLVFVLTLLAAALAAFPAAADRVKAAGTLRGARPAFGRPSRLDRTSNLTCIAGWSNIGLRVGLYNLGGLNPCGRGDVGRTRR